jgi:hypothetical protein
MNRPIPGLIAHAERPDYSHALRPMPAHAIPEHEPGASPLALMLNTLQSSVEGHLAIAHTSSRTGVSGFVGRRLLGQYQSTDEAIQRWDLLHETWRIVLDAKDIVSEADALQGNVEGVSVLRQTAKAIDPPNGSLWRKEVVIPYWQEIILKLGPDQAELVAKDSLVIEIKEGRKHRKQPENVDGYVITAGGEVYRTMGGEGEEQFPTLVDWSKLRELHWLLCESGTEAYKLIPGNQEPPRN